MADGERGGHDSWVSGNQRLVMAGRRQHQHGVDTVIGAKDLSQGGPLVGTLPDDRLEGTDARFHLDQDCIQTMVKPDIR